MVDDVLSQAPLDGSGYGDGLILQVIGCLALHLAREGDVQICEVRDKAQKWQRNYKHVGHVSKRLGEHACANGCMKNGA